MPGEKVISTPYELFANLCGSVESSTCPLSSSPILAVNKDDRDCIEIGERLSGEVYLNNATNGLSGGFQLPFGQVRCCSRSTASDSHSQPREINLRLEFFCNSNSPDLELSESSLDVLSVIGDCNGINNLTIILLTAKLCPENIISLTSTLPTWIIIVVIVAILIIAVIIISVKCNKRCRRSKPKAEPMEKEGSEEAKKLLDEPSESKEEAEPGLINLPVSRGQLHSQPEQAPIASDKVIQEVEEFENDYGGIRSDSTFLKGEDTMSLPTTTS